jgi:hypothetical protein
MNGVKERAIFKRDWKAYSTLVGGFIWMLYPGSIYITGNLSPYVASYFGVTTVQTSNLMLTGVVLNSFISPFGTYLIQQHINPKLIILLGACFGLPLLYAA